MLLLHSDYESLAAGHSDVSDGQFESESESEFGHYYKHSLFIVDLAVRQISRSTERISSFGICNKPATQGQLSLPSLRGR